MRALSCAALLVVAACGVQDEDNDLEADPTLNAPDEGVGGAIVDELVSYSCNTHTATGYRNGNAFTITLVTVAGQSMEMSTANALLTMSRAAELSGVLIRFSSPDAAFRTMAKQQYYWGCFINKNCNSGSPAARPGYSNHQSGHAVDLNTANGAVFNWLNAHAAAYGFRRTDSREKWHWEWWGGGNPTQYCGNCVCSAGQSQTKACGDCGTTTRACNGCQWNGWSACNGPDPMGGTQVCNSGSKGVCEESRMRCYQGNIACRPNAIAAAETCDGLDNDCNGEVDDGNPAVGSVAPAFAATLTDVSYPRTLQSGERATVWAEFRNDGATTWTRENLWLSSRSATSKLYATQWPASTVPALLDHPVRPGELGRFTFEVVASAELQGALDETFTLQRSDGIVVACPSGDIAVSMKVTAPTPIAVVPEANANGHTTLSSCGCTSGGEGLFGLIALALLGVRRRR